MNRRQSVLVILCTLLLIMSGCTMVKPTVEMVPVKPAADTPVPAESTAMPATDAPAAAPTAATVAAQSGQQPAQPTAAAAEAAAPTAAAPDGAALLSPEMPPEEPVPAGQVVDLAWGWAQGLAADQWFELQVRPDHADTEYEVFEWLLAPKVRITSADLLPGVYLWRVVVVQGRDDARGDEISAMSVERRFILTRPSVMGRTLPTAEASATPMPTQTARIVYVTVVPSLTPMPPTPTSTLDPYAQPTAPTATSTPGSYVTPVVPTATPTTGGYPAPTATSVAPTATQPAATETPAPRLTDTPEATAYPAPTTAPTTVPTTGPTTVPTAYPYPTTGV